MKGNDCPLCSGSMEEKKVPYAFAGVSLGSFQAEVCAKCGEAFFTKGAWKEIERLAQRRHLWGTLGRRAHADDFFFTRNP